MEWWIHITGELPDRIYGPYPTQEVAIKAMQDSLLIEGECQEDCYDCWVDQTGPYDQDLVTLVDLEDEYYTS